MEERIGDAVVRGCRAFPGIVNDEKEKEGGEEGRGEEWRKK